MLSTKTLPSANLLDSHAPLIPVPGCRELLAHQTENVFALWHAWELECSHECDVPFWALVWPGAVVLASYIMREPASIADKRVLDWGCGGAIAGIAAAKAGAHSVIANDIDPVALHIAQYNAHANDVRLITMDTNLLHDPDTGPLDYILVADMFYTKRQSEEALALLLRKRHEGASVMIADSGRPFTPIIKMQIIHEERVSVNFDIEGVESRNVRIGLLNTE